MKDDDTQLYVSNVESMRLLVIDIRNFVVHPSFIMYYYFIVIRNHA